VSDANAQLTGRNLDRAIAEALGLVTQFQPHNEWWYLTESEDRGRQFTPIPDYSIDANAVIDVCAARGWYLSFTGNSALIAYDIGGGFARTHRGDGATPQEAAARALLAALSGTPTEGQG
jgi:hypothetical protein